MTSLFCRLTAGRSAAHRANESERPERKRGRRVRCNAIFGGGNFMTAKTSPRQALPEAGAFANRRWYCLFRTAAVGMLWVASRRPH